MRRNFGLDLLQARDKASVAHQLRDDGVIRMSPVDRVSDDDPRLETSDDYGDPGAILRRVLNSAVRESKIFANRNSHYLRRLGCFFGAELRSTTTCHLARGEVENSRRSAE